jgi:HlyD family secretion protein
LKKLARRKIIETISATVKSSLKKKVKISPDVSGEIVELTVSEGDHVEKNRCFEDKTRYL